MRYFCKKLNIEQRFTTAYNPASNGETERFNSMTTILRKELVDGHHDDWEDVLGEVCFAYRSSIHSSTNESPYYMCFGRYVNFPINKILGAVPDPVPSSNYVDTF
jgi:transposase InsO family protein